MSLLYVQLNKELVGSPSPTGFTLTSPWQLMETLWTQRDLPQIILVDSSEAKLVLDQETLDWKKSNRPDPRLLNRHLSLLREHKAVQRDQLAPLKHFLSCWSGQEDPLVVLTLFESWRSELGKAIPDLLRFSASLYEKLGRQDKAQHLNRQADEISGHTHSLSQDEAVARATELTVSCFGPPRIALAGQILRDESWRTRKALSLFLYLALERREASSAQLQEIMWPGRGSENKGNLQTTMSRIRKTLKKAGWQGRLERSRGGLYSLRPQLSNSPREDFENRAKQALENSQDYKETARVVESYKGPYLEGLEDQWVRNSRRRLKLLWFRLAKDLHTFYLDRREFGLAQALVSKMLSFDGVNESAHLAKIETLFRQRRPKEAVQAFKRFKVLLSKSAGLSPSPEFSAQFLAWKRER